MEPEIKCKYSKLVDPSTLSINPENPNVHSDEQLRLLAKNISVNGWRHPILVSLRSNMVVVGHARLACSIAKGWKLVPVDFQEFESEAVELAFLSADNELGKKSDADSDLMKSLLKKIETSISDIELSGIGYSETLKILSDERSLNDETIPRMELQPFESYDYIMFLFDNSNEFSNACERAGITPVEIVYNAKCKKVGLGRVVKGSRLLEMLDK